MSEQEYIAATNELFQLRALNAANKDRVKELEAALAELQWRHLQVVQACKLAVIRTGKAMRIFGEAIRDAENEPKLIVQELRGEGVDAPK
jgi:hypothetical protein